MNYLRAIWSALLCFLALPLFAQQTPYDPAWKKIDSLIAKGLPRSAEAEAAQIYTRAKKEGAEAQMLKALLYRISLQEETREGQEEKALRELEAEARSATGAVRALLQSYMADLYWNYLNRHRWQLRQRTATDSAGGDFATWSTSDFHQKISALFLQSLEPKALLQRTRLEPFDPLIIRGNLRHLRPTLFDLLAHRALPYFKSGDRDLQRPAYAFEITGPEAFLPAAAFARAAFVTKDSLSLQQKALLLYQELIRLHLDDPQKDALIDADLQRLQYVYSESRAAEKPEWYRAALEEAMAGYGRHPEALQAHYLLALTYEQQAAAYQPLGDTTHRWARIKAKEILEPVVRDSSTAAIKNAAGWANAYNLLQELNSTSFSFELEGVNLPGQPFRALVRYRNNSRLFFRLVKAGPAQLEAPEGPGSEAWWKALLAEPVLRNWEQALPPAGDLQEHSVEIKIDALPQGAYYLLASEDASFRPGRGLVGTQAFHVSNIAYVQKDDLIFLLHRRTGQPLSGATAQVIHRTYDYERRRFHRQAGPTFSADKNGRVQINRGAAGRLANQPYLLDLRHGEDRLFQHHNQFYYHPDYPAPQEAPDRHQSFFYTDRSLYRPGQLLHFKGLVVGGKARDIRPLNGRQLTIFLTDANGEKVDSVAVTTNEFGSFSGRFTLPAGRLTGAFTLRDRDYTGGATVMVEEYKRPRFYAEWKPVEGSYGLGDSITVTGNAQAYAGNALPGVPVRYRVTRLARFPYPWYGRGTGPAQQPQEIAHGETVTDASGRFTVTFAALPDRSIDPKTLPVFDYRVQADVTDINGETRSAEQTLSAGYRSVLLQATLPERLVADSLATLPVRTQNMQGTYLPSRVTVQVHRLQPEQRLLRPRYWQQPDQFVMDKAEYVRLFPNDIYANEHEYRHWPLAEQVVQHSDSTRPDGRLPLPARTWAPGFYRLRFTTTDAEGRPVESDHFVEVYDPKNRTLARPEYLWAAGTGAPAEPGTTATVQIGSSASEVFVVQDISRLEDPEAAGKGKTKELTYLAVNGEKKSLSFPVREQDRGGFDVTYFFVKDNRLFQVTDIVRVPWTNKQLQVRWGTFRDKLLPGAKETWTVTISGAKGEQAAAELLAGMYDASLDQFTGHQWERPGIWPELNYAEPWNGLYNFAAVASDLHGGMSWTTRTVIREYDYLLGFRGQPIHRWRNKKELEKARMNGSLSLNHLSGDGAQYDDQDFSAYRRTMAVARAPQAEAAAPQARDKAVAAMDLQEVQVTGTAADAAGNASSGAEKKEESSRPAPQGIVARQNFNETAFFYPDLRTDAAGNITFSFTTPEALTRWKLQALAHTRDLAFGYSRQEIVTQKELMVQPNLPRFLRQGDRMELPVKVVNLSGKELTGQVELQLTDAATGNSVDGWFVNAFPNQYFTVAAGGSEVVRFPMEVPHQFQGVLQWKVIARSDSLSDGEASALPVLTNQVLVTETLPLPVRGTGTQTFRFEKLLNNTSETLQHQALTVEFTSNPAWYAVQALPYLAEPKNESSEAAWNRFYANALAAHIARSAPRVRAVFQQWKDRDTAALLSNLQKNEELKSALLQETPWVLEARTEAEQKRNLAVLFDLVRLGTELQAAFEKVKSAQAPNGGFVWFPGGPDDPQMTRHIVAGIGHLRKLGALPKELAPGLDRIVAAALPYLDKRVQERYQQLLKSKADLKKQAPEMDVLHYLYTRSFYPEVPVANGAKAAYAYYLSQAKTQWTNRTKYGQGLVALVLHRSGEVATAKAVLRSLKETSIVHEELGRYWKENDYGRGWYWWQAPVETQSLLVEAFAEAGGDAATADELRTWLLKNKQTNRWRTSKATAEACYALLLQGTDWLAAAPSVTVQLGAVTVNSAAEKTEEGTGYFRHRIEGARVQPAMGDIRVSVLPAPATGTAAPTATSWGAVYWQYFEDMNAVTAAATPLQLKKQLFVERATDRGPVLSPLTEGMALKVGDKVKVRIELRTDRSMEYLHLKDMRSSSFEPVNVLSGYRWQGGLGYYESTTDLATSFFIHHLPKGTFVFEYPVFVQHAGTFTNGITTIQSLYAPEFSAHSEGVPVRVE